MYIARDAATPALRLSNPPGIGSVNRRSAAAMSSGGNPCASDPTNNATGSSGSRLASPPIDDHCNNRVGGLPKQRRHIIHLDKGDAEVGTGA